MQDRLSLTFTMEVGQLAEAIGVRGGTELLQTTMASIGHSVDERQLQDLPLLGRLRGVPLDPRYTGGIPQTTIGGVSRIGGPFFRPQFQTSQVYQLAERGPGYKSTNLSLLRTFPRGGKRLQFRLEAAPDASGVLLDVTPPLLLPVCPHRATTIGVRSGEDGG